MSGLMSEMVRGGLYKRTQGKITRQVTAASLFITIFIGCWQLSGLMDSNKPLSWVFQYALPGAMVLLGGWFCYRLVNYPKFADFLIAVEAEMNKVNWPSRRELVRASLVVLVTIAVLAAVLALYDAAWTVVLYKLLNIAGTAAKDVADNAAQ